MDVPTKKTSSGALTSDLCLCRGEWGGEGGGGGDCINMRCPLGRAAAAKRLALMPRKQTKRVPKVLGTGVEGSGLQV